MARWSFEVAMRLVAGIEDGEADAASLGLGEIAQHLGLAREALTRLLGEREAQRTRLKRRSNIIDFARASTRARKLQAKSKRQAQAVGVR